MLMVAACGGDDTGGGGGDDCPAYANIVGGSFGRSGAITTWTMELEELPATLPFDQTEVPANVLEYDWTVELDANSDGTTDLEASVKHFRMTNAIETEKQFLDGAQQDLWTVMGAAGSLSGDIQASVAGNTLTFVIDDDEDPLLPMVTQASQGTLKTFTMFGASIIDDVCEDEYPL